MMSGLLSAIRNKQFMSLMGNGVSAFFNLLSFALLVRILTIPEYGSWVIFTMTYNILDQVRTGLLQSGLIKFYAGADLETARRVSGAAWHVSLLLTGGFVVLSFAAYFAATPFLEPNWQYIIPWLGILTVLSLPMNFATWVLQAENRFQEIVYIRVAQNGVFMVLLAVMYVTNRIEISNVMHSYAASMLISSVYCLLRKWTGIRNIAFRTKQQALELYRYGRLIIGSILSSSMINYTNNMVILGMLGSTGVALFSLPQKFMEVIELLLRSFVATAQPTISAAANRNDRKAIAVAFCRYTGTVTLLIIPIIIVLMVFTEPILTILTKTGYDEAKHVVRITLLTAILWPIDRFNGVTLDMINLPDVNFYKNMLKLVLNAVLAVGLVWLFPDIISVAIAGFLHIIFATIYGYRIMKKHTDVRFMDIWRFGWAEIKQLYSKVLKFRHA